jgi:hypothetical protein
MQAWRQKHQSNQPAESMFTRKIRVFAIGITGLFSICSQVWEAKNASARPLLSVSCQVWEPEQIFDRRAAGRQKLAR